MSYWKNLMRRLVEQRANAMLADLMRTDRARLEADNRRLETLLAVRFTSTQARVIAAHLGLEGESFHLSDLNPPYTVDDVRAIAKEVL